MLNLATALDKHLIPDLANIVLEYCQLERVDEVIDGRRRVYIKLFCNRHGEYKDYYPTGELQNSSYWINDKPHGEDKGYYRTGELRYSHHWVNGKQHGEFKDYDRNGEVLYFEPYVNGKLHGETKYYFRNGEMWDSSRWINGVKQ